jgi:Peptidase family M23
MSRRVLATTFLLPLLAAPAAQAAAWHRPLQDGTTARPFVYDRTAPFVAGQRRGIDVAGPPGARVAAVCTGVVRHAGRVPRWGRGVTLRCADGLIATELGLARTTVDRDAPVVAGMEVGRLAAGGVLRVGARRPGERSGYVDPAALFGEEGEGAPQVAPPPGTARPRATRRPGARGEPRAVGEPRALPSSSPRPLHAGSPRPASAPAPHPPLALLAGLALLATTATGGAVARRRRTRPRRPAAGMAALQR